MNVRSRIPVIFLSALSFVICADAVLLAQASDPAQQAAQAGGRDISNELSVTVGKSALVDFNKPVTRVAVASGDVAEATGELGDVVLEPLEHIRFKFHHRRSRHTITLRLDRKPPVACLTSQTRHKHITATE